MIANSPLTWPAGRRRPPAGARRRALFNQRSGTMAIAMPLSVAQACDRMLQELDRTTDRELVEVIVSTNLPARKNGLPESSTKQPADPGVAVYWRATFKGPYRAIAIDLYDRVADNLAAVAATLDALRAIGRHGGAAVMEQAFTGFEQLPSPTDWRHVFGLKDGEVVSMVELKRIYRALAPSRHPDTGGTHEAMAQLNMALTQAEEELDRSNREGIR